MRSALICVFIALIVHKDGSSAENDEDFKPTPIPLSNWPIEKQDTGETLQEIIKPETPPTVAVVPAHYWEDALRHSVYLTLVRDKIDQLIAKGSIISPDSKQETHLSKEVDGHDLWEKIKTARFDRLKEEPIPPGDVTILAKGRLLEDEEGFRFAEDDASRTNCSENNCTKDVKAYWSVKRIRQGETPPGKYHYELTFSVTSQTSKKLKKSYENPVRTFTIKENAPTERPQARSYEHIRTHAERPQRAVWVHKNIGHTQSTERRPSYNRGLDRIFSSLFSDEDSYEEPPYRHKQKTYISQIYPQHAKAGYVDDRDHYHQKKQISYPVPKPQSIRYTHPPIPPPPPSYVQHPYLNVDPIENNPYMLPYSDNRYVPSNLIKTTRPAVLPTPVASYPLEKESSMEIPVLTKLNRTEHTTRVPNVQTTYRIYNTPKQQMKINYFPDHIRPPVYNAPPGVFVTMDKKPFKPMPPLKYAQSNKSQKTIIPSDFRPSPQVHDTQFSDPDAIPDTAFRPISMNYTEMSNVKESNDIGKRGNKNIRKSTAAKKPPKKHEIVKPHRLTTVKPEIITAHSQPILVGEDNSMEWANVLGAFTKTTPMASHKERVSAENTDPIATTPLTTPTVDDSVEYTEDIENIEAFYEAEIRTISSNNATTTTTTTTTTPKPKKRTRPPPKFTKQERIKKHKRVTSTTATTAKPIPKYLTKKPSDDLTPQASSAATSGTNTVWETKTHNAPITTTMSSANTNPSTTTKMTTTSSTISTTSTPSTPVDTEQPAVTTQPKSKNRFRQSTLMQKGTSVNHNKWSTLEKNRTNSGSNNFPLRRKASKFQGYIPLSTPRSPEVERDKEDHRDHAFNSNSETISSTIEQTEDIMIKATLTTQPTVQEQDANNELPSEWNHESETNDDNEDEEEAKETDNAVQVSKDDNEYIFPTASTTHEVKTQYINVETPLTTAITVDPSAHSDVKNKTKCKKKKHNNLTTTKGAVISTSETETTSIPTTPSTTTITATSVTPDIFEELFGGFTMDDATEKPKTESLTPPSEQKVSESEKHERYIHIDDDIENFLHSLDQNSNHHLANDDTLEGEEEYADDDEDEDSPYNDEENSHSKNFNDEYYDEAQESQDRQLSLLELMTME